MSGIVWWEIESRDPDAFMRFHAAWWGWEFRRAFQDTALGADYWLILADGSGIGGLQRSGVETAPQVGTRVEVDDLEATLREVEGLGGRIERRRTELGGDDRWFATVLDPSGVSIGLWTAHPA